MRLAALRAGALAPRDADGIAPIDVLSNGSELMRSPEGIFGNAGMSLSANAAKNVLDSTMAQNAATPAMQPLPTMRPPLGMAFRGATPINMDQRFGGGYDPATGSMSLTQGPAASPTGIAALDGVAPLDTTAPTTIADPTKGGVNDRIHPKFFEHGGLGGKILQGIQQVSQAMAVAGGNPAAIAEFENQLAMKQAAAADARRLAIWRAQEAERRRQELDDRNYEDNQKPRYFAGNEDYRRYNPSNGTVDTLFDAPRPEQEYASQFGQPGSPEYQTALQDYVLKGWGSTAMAGRTQLNDDRFQQRLQLKQTPTYSNLHPRQPAPRAARPPTVNTQIGAILGKVSTAGAGSLSPGEAEIYNTWKNGRYGGRRGGGAGTGGGAVSEGTIIKNPTTGQRMKMQGGKWVAI